MCGKAVVPIQILYNKTYIIYEKIRIKTTVEIFNPIL